MRRKIAQALVALAITIVVVACGGGGAGTTTPSGLAPSSVATPVMATGTITGFGSIFVNGVHFQTSAATIRKNGQMVAQSELAVGEIARVKGSMDDHGGGNCESVDVDNNVIGAIAAIDAANSTLTVLGQTVKVNAGTSFSMNIQPGDITGLAVGDFVEVSGMTDANSAIAATRITRKASPGTLQVIGAASSVDTAAHTFKINALIVNYSTATLEGFTGGQPKNGDAVEVRGTAFNGTTTTLTATRVELQSTDHNAAGDDRDLEREGLITRFVSPTDFDVAGKPVTTSSTTTFRNGTAADLALNTKVEVEGKLNSAGVLVADKVEFHHNGGVALRANVTAVNATASTITVLGVQITINANTRLEDKTSAHVEKFSLADISSGDTVEVRGFESPAGSGKLVATRIEREPASTAVKVGGPFKAGTSPQFTIVGITVDASSARLRGAFGGALSLADFLAQAVGKNVEVSGQLTGTVVMASEARIGGHEGNNGNDD
jgi:hypothetical protein